MNLADLIGIGKLGGVDGDGWFQILVKPRYRDALAAAEEVYLIFNSDRVFFVTISEREINDRKLRLKFAEDGVAEERQRHKDAVVALPAVPQSKNEPETLLGYAVLLAGETIGSVSDYFHNNAQYVLVVSRADGSEILIPLVDYYMEEILPEQKSIVLRNAESLLNAAGTPQ
ncbi:MAG TPA: hypothetical protein PKH19_05890 [Candidatus Syntrophosphaera sp.]|nr:hypothetical protein [Candidatus Syntrophosphaera sp.]